MKSVVFLLTFNGKLKNIASIMKKLLVFISIIIDALCAFGSLTEEELAVLRGGGTTELNLRERSLSLEDMKTIAKALSDGKILRKLTITDIEIGVEGAKALGEAVAVNSTLIELVLKRNSISSKVKEELGIE